MHPRGRVALVVLALVLPAQNAVAEDAPRTVFIVNAQDASVSAVNLEAMREVERRPVVATPCCIERILGTTDVLVSNLGDGTLARVHVSPTALSTRASVRVGAAPKRVAFLP